MQGQRFPELQSEHSVCLGSRPAGRGGVCCSACTEGWPVPWLSALYAPKSPVPEPPALTSAAQKAQGVEAGISQADKQLLLKGGRCSRRKVGFVPEWTGMREMYRLQ